MDHRVDHDDDGDEPRLAQLLRRAEPAPLDPATAERVYEQAWQAIRAGIAEEPGGASLTGPGTDRGAVRRLDVIAAADARARRRRRLTRTTAITTAVLLAGAGAAAAGTFVATRTGVHNTGWEVDAGGPGEDLDSDGSDRTKVFTDLIADIPFAPGYERLKAAELVTGQLKPEPGAVVSEGAARGYVARDAICTWADAWVAADAAGDRAARETATRGLAGSLRWPAVRDLDPDPSPTGYVGDSGVGSATLFGTVPRMIDAAQDGERQPVLDAIAVDGWCLDDYIPATLADPSFPGPRYGGQQG